MFPTIRTSLAGKVMLKILLSLIVDVLLINLIPLIRIACTQSKEFLIVKDQNRYEL